MKSTYYHWTKGVFIVIFCPSSVCFALYAAGGVDGDVSSEIALKAKVLSLEAELAEARRRVAELVVKDESRSAKAASLLSWATLAVATGDPSARRLDTILESVRKLSSQARKAAAEATALSKEMSDALTAISAPESIRAALMLRAEGIAERCAAMAEELPLEGRQLNGTAKVLEVDEALGVVVISAGMARGVRVGLMLHIREASGARIRIVHAGADASAGVPVDSLDGIAPGMTAEAGGPQ